jgi:hypothetical protein
MAALRVVLVATDSDATAIYDFAGEDNIAELTRLAKLIGFAGDPMALQAELSEAQIRREAAAGETMAP